MQLRFRSFPEQAENALRAAGLSPIEARVYAARGIGDVGELDVELKRLLPYQQLLNAEKAAIRLADAIAGQERILIVADYDADGATACAVGLRGLRAMGAVVDFLVPNRFEYGYGLTPEIVDLAAKAAPRLIVTVDNGIASVAGVERARQLGIEVLVTDHHLPGDALPAALIVNPNQPGCPFPSKALAGVGVMFYVLLALRAELRNRQAFTGQTEPNLASLLDLVALGTVADVARLDANNRILVQQGLRRMRAGKACMGILSLFRAAGRDHRRASAFDLGFTLGPRLNAAGRLDDMTLGIVCLSHDDPDVTDAAAQRLDLFNRERRVIEAHIQEAAQAVLETIKVDDRYSLCLYDPTWHQGVVGIVASRLKDRHHRPAMVFAKGGDDEIKGSGRSTAGLHLRDALDLVAKQHPGLLRKFGGHAAAAGVTLAEADLPLFAEAFEAVCRDSMGKEDLDRLVETDGELAPEDISLPLAECFDAQVWGQGFPQPLFVGEFRVVQQRVVGEKHLKLKLAAHDGRVFEAMRFQHAEPLPAQIHAVYRLSVNEYNGSRLLQLLIEHCL